MTVRKTKLPALCAEQRQELVRWIGEHAEELPSVVNDAFLHYILLVDGLAGDKGQLSSALLQLRRALGIMPSSERRKNSGDPIGPTSKPGDSRPKDPIEQLRLSRERYLELSDWHKNLASGHKRNAKKVDGKILELEDLTEEEEKARCKKENAEHIARLQLGDGPEPALESSTQAFMRGGDVRVDEQIESANVNPDRLIGEEIVSHLYDERTRYGFSLSVQKITVEVEKVVVKAEGNSTRIISASTREIGPPRMDVTWEFLANTSIMVAQYAMPFNRLGSLLTIPDKRFTSAMLSRMFCYVARRFLPVYLYNFRQLSNARLLSGDDTTTRVVEFARFFQELQLDPKSLPPWLSFGTSDVALATMARDSNPSLGVLTAAELGFESGRKDGSGPKKSLQTTVISGRSDQVDPRSAIVFYRSHIGGFGNLLSTCLSNRREECKDLTVQSDLSSVNLVSNIQLMERFNIEQVGCTSHARRPFALYESDDPELCGFILHSFKGLYIYEKGLDLYGRNNQNVRAVRGVDGRQMWEDIKEFATIITKKWSKTTKLGDAAHYILRHYQKLTAYLSNPIISISNDFSERMLRMEKLIQANSLFRNSLEGRFALDINRTILQTAIAAQAPLQEYLVHVLKASHEEVAAHPENFTALAYDRQNPTQ